MYYHVGKCILRTVPSAQTVPLDRTAPAVLLVLVNKVLEFTKSLFILLIFQDASSPEVFYHGKQ